METKAGIQKGDYIVNTSDLVEYGSDDYFEAKAIGTSQKLKTEQLHKPNVAVTGSNQLLFTVKELGFNVVNPENADVIVSDSGHSM